MRLFRKIFQMPLKDNKGFTLLELMVVIATMGILASIAVANFIPLREKAFDSVALSDARNLVESVLMATLNDEDVDYTKVNTGGAVGDIDNEGNSRTPVFFLSPGVEAVITGTSNEDPNGGLNGDTTMVDILIYHTKGTDDPFSLSGKNKKDYACSVDESTGIASAP